MKEDYQLNFRQLQAEVARLAEELRAANAHVQRQHTHATWPLRPSATSSAVSWPPAPSSAAGRHTTDGRPLLTSPQPCRNRTVR